MRAVHIARCYAVRHRQHFERAQHVTRNATRRWRRPDRHPRCSLPKATRRWPGHEKVATACTETGLRPQALPQGSILSVLKSLPLTEGQPSGPNPGESEAAQCSKWLTQADFRPRTFETSGRKVCLSPKDSPQGLTDSLSSSTHRREKDGPKGLTDSL